MNNSKMIKIIMPILVVIIISGCVSTPPEIIKIKVGYMQVADCLQLFVAQEKGFFEAEGLEVEAVSMAGGAVIAPAVESGELDFGFSNIISIISAHEAGSDFEFLVPGAFKDAQSADMFQMVVSVDSDIDEPKDVEGKTVAVNTFNNIVELGMRAWAEDKDVDFDKISLVEVPFPQMESALENKEIDVAFFVEPFPTLSVSDGVAKVFDDKPLDSLADSFMVASWFAKDSWVKENPEKAAAFINAMNKANEYIIENPGEMPYILSKNARLTEELAAQITIPTFKESISKQDLQAMIDASYDYGYITEKFDATEIVIDGLVLK